MDRQTVLNTLLASTAITALVTETVAGAAQAQVFLWMSPNPDVFPRLVMRELDDGTSQGADNHGVWFRQLYEVAFTVKASDWATFISLAALIPAVMATIGGRHVSSTPDNPIPDAGVVTKSMTFEFFSDNEEV